MSVSFNTPIKSTKYGADSVICFIGRQNPCTSNLLIIEFCARNVFTNHFFGQRKKKCLCILLFFSSCTICQDWHLLARENFKLVVGSSKGVNHMFNRAVIYTRPAISFFLSVNGILNRKKRLHPAEGKR